MPIRLVMIFMGYRLAAEAHAFTAVPKYGATSLVLYRAAFAIFPPGHETLVTVNTVLGCLGIAALVGFLARHRPPPWTVAFAAVLLAAVPVFLKDHRSESILVPAAAFLFVALVFWDAFLVEKRRIDLAGAAVFAALALTTRPEMLLVVPLALSVAAWARGCAALRGGWRPASAVALLVAAAVVPHGLHVFSAGAEQAGRGALPSLDQDLPVATLRGLYERNLVLIPELFPLGVTALALAAPLLVARAQRRLAVGLWVVAVGWISCYFVDLPRVSIPRLHAPGGMLVAVAAALSAGALMERTRLLTLSLSPRPLRALALLLAVAATAPKSARFLWAPTNEDEEEWFIQEALAHLPREPVCLVRIGDQDDPPPTKTHRYFPDYLLRPPRRADKVLDIRTFERGEVECPGGAYFYLGVRCYAVYVPFGEPKPAREPMVSSCARLRSRPDLVPVVERTIDSHGDNEFYYYPDGFPRMPLGLYRIGGRP